MPDRLVGKTENEIEKILQKKPLQSLYAQTEMANDFLKIIALYLDALIQYKAAQAI